MRKVCVSLAVAAGALVFALGWPNYAEAGCKTCEQGITECMVCTLGCSDSGICGSTCVSNSCGHCGLDECNPSDECSCSGTVRFDELASATYDNHLGDFASVDASEVSTLRFASADGRNVSRRICDATISERHYTEGASSTLLRETHQIVL